MPYHNLNLESVMAQCVCPTTSSMPKNALSEPLFMLFNSNAPQWNCPGLSL